MNRAFCDFLPDLVGDSGGMYTTLPFPDPARRRRARFSTDLESQYMLGYVPKRPPDGIVPAD